MLCHSTRNFTDNPVIATLVANRNDHVRMFDDDDGEEEEETQVEGKKIATGCLCRAYNDR